MAASALCDDVTARGPLALEDLLAVEDEPALLAPRCQRTGVLLWPLVRMVFMRMLLSDLLYSTPLVTVGAGQASLSRRALGTLARSAIHNAVALASGRARADVCIMTDALGTRLHQGKWFNRLSDHFALALPSQTIVVEDHFEWNWPMPRHFPSVLFHAPWQAQSAIKDRFLVRAEHLSAADQLIGLASARAGELFGWTPGESRVAALREMLACKLAGLPGKVDRYRSLFGRIRPRVLLLDSACYGPSSPVIAAARSLGIVVAEFQHGAVSRGHDVYNVARTLRESPDYAASLPDHFLAYGKWWGEQINVPVAKVTVGNPHRDAQLDTVHRPSDRREVLLLGDGIETAKYLDFAMSLVSISKKHGVRIVFRPHPLERMDPVVVNHQGSSGVEIDTRSDIYESLARAHVVVSEQSSGLFEAIGLADRILIWDTPKSRLAFPQPPFKMIESPSDIDRALGSADEGRVSAKQAFDFWAPDWRSNYLRFIRDCGVRAAP